MLPSSRIQRPALRAAAEHERWALQRLLRGGSSSSKRIVKTVPGFRNLERLVIAGGRFNFLRF